MSVRVRYAPSPTGLQHIGGIRTALINYLFAKSNNGSFIVRIEDTDRTRSQDRFVTDLLDSLSWLGIEPDEFLNTGAHAPYVQSQRLSLYQKYAQELLDKGHAYYCYTSVQSTGTDTNSGLETETELESAKTPYDRSSRDLNLQEILFYKEQGIVPVLRLKLPLEGEIAIEDELLGSIRRKAEDVIIDPVLMKSDGYPTYHFANVIDDHLMQITHVMRSQEWISTTPVHAYLYQCFEWKSPKFFHLPMVLGEDGQKLSKRNGSISVKELREQGILPEALVNSIALLGWSYDDSREFFSREDLVELYNDGQINKASAKFSMEKLRWFNAHYIRECSSEKLAELLRPYFIAEGWTAKAETLKSSTLSQDVETHTQDVVIQLVPLVRERLEILSDVVPLISYVFEDFDQSTLQTAFAELIAKNGKELLHRGLALAFDVLFEHWEKSVEDIENIIREKVKESGKNSELAQLKLGQSLMPLRIAVTGRTVTPPSLPLIKIIGKQKVKERIEQALALLL